MFLASILASPPTQNANPLLPDWAEVVVGFISFVVVFGVLAKILLPRIQKTLEERTDAIEGGLKRAEEAQAEAKRTLEEYHARLAEARHEASRFREEAREQAAQILAEAKQEAKTEQQRLIAAAHAQIEADRQQAFTQLRAEVGKLSIELAGRVVGESLEDEARQRRVVDRFLDELEQQSAERVSQ